MKMLLILAAISTVAGCDSASERPAKTNPIDSYEYYEVCIDGVAYIVIDKLYRGGITARIKQDGMPALCKSGCNDVHIIK